MSKVGPNLPAYPAAAPAGAAHRRRPCWRGTSPPPYASIRRRCLPGSTAQENGACFAEKAIFTFKAAGLLLKMMTVHKRQVGTYQIRTELRMGWLSCKGAAVNFSQARPREIDGLLKEIALLLFYHEI